MSESKFNWLFILVLVTSLTAVGFAEGFPALQLDIERGGYDWNTETVMSADYNFTLYALLSSDNQLNLNNNYVLSAAIVPYKDRYRFGSFVFNGQIIKDSDIFPDEQYFSNKGMKTLEAHAGFESSFYEYPFKFNAANRATAYNVQDNPGGMQINPYGKFYYSSFEVNLQGVKKDFALHFDLYGVGNHKKLVHAPFSHDAQGLPIIPEPDSILLLIGGLGVIFALRRGR